VICALQSPLEIPLVQAIEDFLQIVEAPTRPQLEPAWPAWRSTDDVLVTLDELPENSGRAPVVVDHVARNARTSRGFSTSEYLVNFYRVGCRLASHRHDVVVILGQSEAQALARR